MIRGSVGIGNNPAMRRLVKIMTMNQYIPFKLIEVKTEPKKHGINTTHGLSGSPEYKAYQMAKQRCTNPKDKRYADYGGRGIEFKFASFEEFIGHIGLKHNFRLQLDRIDNNGPYQVGNVRWATREQQAHSKRRRLKARGCYFNGGCEKPWYAQIMKNYKTLCLGSFHTEKEAHEAYEKAKRELK